MNLRRSLLPVVFALAAVPGFGQEYRGTILGRITDPSDAPVMGAAIEVINVDTAVVSRSTSNEAGNYQVPLLVPGNYQVKVNHPGFKAMERGGIRVAANAQVTLDFALAWGRPPKASR